MSIPLATTHNYSHQNPTNERANESTNTSPLEAYSDHALHRPSSLTSRDSFDHQLQLLEEGSSVTLTQPKRSWWDSIVMAIRARRKPGLSATVGDVTEGLLANANANGNGNGNRNGYAELKAPTRKRGCWNYCLFGGISSLIILALLFMTNISMAISNLIYDNYFDPALQNWGKPNTGTEGLSWYPTDLTRDIIPIPCHSHNDYWRRVPLFSAIRAGCTGVEADVWLYTDQLYVGHNTASLTHNRTFQSLYILPLVHLLESQNPQSEFYNGSQHGVFDTDPDQSLTLLVDVKTGGKETWPWVLRQLEPLRERGWLTYVQNGMVHPRPVTVVGTGNTPFDVLMKNASYRDAFFDAPLNDMWESLNADDEPLDVDIAPATPSARESRPANVGQGLSGVSPDDEFSQLNSYYASVSFASAVGWLWRGKLTQKQIEVIRGQVRGAHRRGLKVRYWDLPAWPIRMRNEVWKTLVKEGVDVLNVDDLRGVSKGLW